MEAVMNYLTLICNFCTMEIATEQGIYEGLQRSFEKQRIYKQQLKLSGPKERKQKLRQVKSWILANKQLVYDAVKSDLGKSAVEAEITEILPAILEINKAIDKIHQWMRPRTVSPTLITLGTKTRVHVEPKGNCLIMAPWNYPFNLTVGPLASAIAAGNTAIIKPSEHTPATSGLIVKMMKELFDEQEVAVFEGGVDVGQAVLELPFDHIFFTGSPRIGKIVMEAAAKHLTSVTLELGGKSPTIVDETADLKDAAAKIIWGKTLNCGQICISPDHVYVHEHVAGKLIELMKAKIHEYYKNDLQQSDYPRIVSDKHFEHLKKLLENALDNGAKLITGGEMDADDKFFSPTIITEVADESMISREEIFGPILPIYTYSNLSDVITKINSQPKPLALYIFSRSSEHQKRLINETSHGTACINENVVQFAHTNAPFGGVNNSGIGKSHGYAGFIAFSNEKMVLKQRTGFTVPKLFYPPYNGLQKKIVELVEKFS